MQIRQGFFPGRHFFGGDKLIRQSIEYAYANHYKELTDYVKKHSQEMSEDVMRKHIDLYVNNYSLALGHSGKKAIINLMKAHKDYNVNITAENIFLQ